MKFIKSLLLITLLFSALAFAAPHKTGQRVPDTKRIQEIQSSLIEHGYAPGHNWKETQESLQSIARYHGWQTKHVPDARVLILLGLGNQYSDPSVTKEPGNRLDKKLGRGKGHLLYNEVYTEKQLQRWYEGYNEILFSNQLAPGIVIWADLTDDMGTHVVDADGTHRITLDRKTNNTPRTARWTLIHEMCHAKVGDNTEVSLGYTAADGPEDTSHGPIWQACMVGVAEHGGFKDIW